MFAADLAGDGIRALHRAPLGGGLPPLELSGPFVLGGELHLNPPGGIRAAFEISADARSVAYLADQDEDGRVELYSVRLDGSRPPRRANRRLPAGGDVESFALQPHGAWIAYLADQEADDEVELFVSALDVDHWLPAEAPRPLR